MVVIQKVSHLQDYKRRSYLMALFGTSVILFISWVFREPDDIFVEFAYPLFLLMILIMFLLVWRISYPLRKLELWIYGLVTLFVLSRLLWHFHFFGPIDDNLLSLAGGHYWAVGACILGAFVVFHRYHGLLVGMLIILLSAIIAGCGVQYQFKVGGVTEISVVYILRIHFFLIVLLALSSAVAIMREELLDAIRDVTVLNRDVQTDNLTNLANRRPVEHILIQQMGLFERYSQPFSVILADVDKFKLINDKWGHFIGDEVLVEIANRFAATARKADFVSRWGGEEFLIIAPHSDTQEAFQLAERIRKAIADKPIEKVGNVTVSLGVAEVKTDETKEELLKRADAAMYAAKAKGRNCSVIG